jgi:hypothetical protein
MEPHDRIAERAHPFYYPRILFVQKRKVVDYRVERNGNGNHCGGDHQDLMQPQVTLAERVHPYYYPRILFLQGHKVVGIRRVRNGNGNGNGNGCQ